MYLPDTEETRELSAYLIRSRGFQVSKHHRPLHIGFCTGRYGGISSATIEVEGTPTQGMVVVRLENGMTEEAAHSREQVDCWIRAKRGMRTLPWDGPRARQIAALAMRCWREHQEAQRQP